MSGSAIMAIIAGVLLLLSFGAGRNAVWRGATLGAVVGVIVSLVTDNWDWLLFIFAVGTFIGTISEWIGRFSEADKTSTQRSVSSLKESDNKRPTLTNRPYYIADMHTGLVHLPTCHAVPLIEEKKLGQYTSIRLAKMAGYAPCKVCNPDKK